MSEHFQNLDCAALLDEGAPTLDLTWPTPTGEDVDFSGWPPSLDSQQNLLATMSGHPQNLYSSALLTTGVHAPDPPCPASTDEGLNFLNWPGNWNGMATTTTDLYPLPVPTIGQQLNLCDPVGLQPADGGFELDQS
jgi:hypothetical protein